MTKLPDRAAKKAALLWLKTKTEFTGNWHIDLDDQAIIVNAVAAELREAYAEIERLAKADRENRSIIRHWQKFSEKIGNELGCGALTDDNLLMNLKEKMTEIARLRAEIAKVKP